MADFTATDLLRRSSWSLRARPMMLIRVRGIPGCQLRRSSVLVGRGLGVVLGSVLGTVAWGLTKRDPSVPETGHVDVDHYDVLVELSHADRARDLLGTPTAG